jgi:hypothetical protein
MLGAGLHLQIYQYLYGKICKMKNAPIITNKLINYKNLFVKMLKIYCSVILASLLVSIVTNNSRVPILLQLNELSNNMVAFLLMPIYIPYRMIKHVILNFDSIMLRIYTMLKPIVVKLYRFVKYLYDKLIIVCDKVVDILHKILNVIEQLWRLFVTYIVNPIYDAIVHICTVLKPFIVNLFNYLYDKLLIIIDVILSNIVDTLRKILNIMELLWLLFVTYIVYPIYDVMITLYNSLISALTHIYYILGVSYDVICHTINKIYNILWEKIFI